MKKNRQIIIISAVTSCLFLTGLLSFSEFNIWELGNLNLPSKNNVKSTRIDKGDSIIVSTNFERGSIDYLTEISPNYLKGKTKHWFKADGIGEQFYWFYFKLHNVPNDTITVELVDMKGTYRGKPHLIMIRGTQPVYSYDQKTWYRIEDAQWDGDQDAFTFRQKFSEREVWIAYAHPYPYSRSIALYDSINSHPYVILKQIGNSREDRPIELITIKNNFINHDKKRVILVLSGQHAGEDAGPYLAEGMIKYLTSKSASSESILQNFIFKFVLLVNPDGFYHGFSRYNAAMEDLDVEWDDDFIDSINSPVEPEVASIKKWVNNWYENGNKIDFCFDLHCYGQPNYHFLSLTTCPASEDFVEKLSQFWGEEITIVKKNETGLAPGNMYHNFKIPSITLELTQSHPKATQEYLTIEDYHDYSKKMVLAIRSHFLKKIEKKDWIYW